MRENFWIYLLKVRLTIARAIAMLYPMYSTEKHSTKVLCRLGRTRGDYNLQRDEHIFWAHKERNSQSRAFVNSRPLSVKPLESWTCVFSIQSDALLSTTSWKFDVKHSLHHNAAHNSPAQRVYENESSSLLRIFRLSSLFTFFHTFLQEMIVSFFHWTILEVRILHK